MNKDMATKPGSLKRKALKGAILLIVSIVIWYTCPLTIAIIRMGQ